MLKLSSEADQVCVAKATEAGQEHIFDGWDDLGADERRQLIGDVQGVDFQRVQKLVRKSFLNRDESGETRVLRPPQIDRLPTQEDEPERWAELKALGEEALAAGKIGIVLVAGASSTRLGGPVATIPIGPVSGKTVLQLHAERVRALNLRHRVSLRWWVVAEQDGDHDIEAWFRDQGCFGLGATDVKFVEQARLPLVNRRGKMLLADRARIALGAVGHGGALLHFMCKDQLKKLRSRRIEHLFFFQMDNPLARIADPVFLGHHIAQKAEMTSKAVRRKDAAEPLGVFCKNAGSIEVIEHAELADEDRNQVDENGDLTFAHGNMSAHTVSVDFLERLVEEKAQLPVHTRERIQPCLGKKGRKTRPTEPNCMQFRFLLFDALQLTDKASVVECDRRAEFSPIRSATGENSPLSAQQSLSRDWLSWFDKSPSNGSNNSRSDGTRTTAEVSPLFALDRNELQSRNDLPEELPSEIYLEPGGGRG